MFHETPLVLVDRKDTRCGAKGKCRIGEWRIRIGEWREKCDETKKRAGWAGPQGVCCNANAGEKVLRVALDKHIIDNATGWKLVPILEATG